MPYFSYTQYLQNFCLIPSICLSLHWHHSIVDIAYAHYVHSSFIACLVSGCTHPLSLLYIFFWNWKFVCVCNYRLTAYSRFKCFCHSIQCRRENLGFRLLGLGFHTWFHHFLIVQVGHIIHSLCTLGCLLK